MCVKRRDWLIPEAGKTQQRQQQERRRRLGPGAPAGWQSLLSFTVLFLAWLAGFSSRLFAVIRFESIIHEFDPWAEEVRTRKGTSTHRMELK
ncbi:hypothetical protein CRUP_003364 [Coryphaenoides rupestris]|nr:hypothetical protein CRUP_003364 [Coryphaenoides rupestris]